MYNCALLSEGLSLFSFFCFFDHLPENALYVILVKSKRQELHDLIIGEDVRSLDELLQHPAADTKSMRPFFPRQTFDLRPSDPDLVLVKLLLAFGLLSFFPELCRRFLFSHLNGSPLIPGIRKATSRLRLIALSFTKYLFYVA